MAGGRRSTAAMDEAGLEPHFVQGRRYTDEATLKIVTRVLGEEICESLVDEIKAQGGRAVALNQNSQFSLIGEPLTIPDEQGEPMSLGRVGKVVDIRRELLSATCRADTVPVIPSLAVDRAGELLNVNADTAAAAVAKMLGAEKLVFLSDVEGIFLDRSDRSTLQRHLTAARCRELIAAGIIDAGMIPKVEASIEALEAGVKKVHMVDARFPALPAAGDLLGRRDRDGDCETAAGRMNY